MGEIADSLKPSASILVSRNTPLAFIVGVAGFVGSHLAEKLLAHGVQVVGVDDFSTGSPDNLTALTKNRHFHLINRSVTDSQSLASLKLPRVDYAFFVAESEDEELYTKGLLNFLNFLNDNTEFVKEHLEKDDSQLKSDLKSKPRIVYLSSIALYGNHLSDKERLLKDGEIRFARFIKHHKLNGRILRTSTLFGPRMHFREEDPIVRLIQGDLLNKLQEVPTSVDFSTRSLFIDDATQALVKTVLSGSTAQKIFDVSLLTPIKIVEIKQILMDPLWHEMKHFSPSELPPWPTPNLLKTMKELSWQPKTHIIEGLKKTVSFFRDHQITVPEFKEEIKFDQKKWSFKNFLEPEAEEEKIVDQKEEKPLTEKKLNRGIKYKKRFVYLLCLILILYSLFYPLTKLVWGGLTIKNSLKNSSQAITEGDFNKARREVGVAKASINEASDLVNSLILLKRMGILTTQISQAEQFVGLMSDGIEGVDQAISGTQALFQTTKIISGEDVSDPAPFFQTAQTDLTASSQKISRVNAYLKDQQFLDSLPGLIKSRVVELDDRLAAYSRLVEQARSASFLLPKVVGVEGKRVYLVLLQNNLELRAGGGFIGSYAKLTFDKGRIAEIKVDDIYNLDGALQERIEPPLDLKTDLGLDRLFLRDANYESDFPTSAKQAEVLYRKESGETINGVIAMDLAASGYLIDAVGGLDLPDYGEHIGNGNLFEKAISHAEVNFFPGSQAKRNYLTSLQLNLFNKIFYLSKQNWPAVIQAVNKSLTEKHLMVYLSDLSLFSYLASENWAGVLPRGVEAQAGQTLDFLATVEANYGANKSNFYLDRKYKLETNFSKEGGVAHKLTISYKNNSPSEVFPAGKYKNRFKIYLPLGTKLTRASFGEQDITTLFAPFADYGRTGYTVLIELAPKEQKNLVLEYSLGKPLNFQEGKVSYRLDIIKQPGTMADSFDWNVVYPINYKISTTNPSEKNVQELNFVTDLLTDRSYLLEIQNTVK